MAWFALVAPALDYQFSVRIDTLTTFVILPFAGIVALLSRYVACNGRSFRFLAGLTTMGAAVLQLAILGGMPPAVISLVLGIALVILSYPVREKGLLLLGLGGTVFSLAYHARYAADFYQSNLWLSLAATGVAVILAASYIERNWQALLLQGRDVRSKLHHWN